MTNGANGTISTCSGNFRDGGGTGNYANSQSSTITICPSTPGTKVQLVFTQFNTEIIGTTVYDYLEMWQGSTIAGPAFDTFAGAPAVPFTVTSSSPDGCLTFRFTSDSSVTLAGWTAAISCVVPCSVATTPVANLVNTSAVNICPTSSLSPGSTTVAFDASNSTNGGYTNNQFTWDWGDGTTSVTATPTTSHTYPTTPGVYIASVVVRNSNGCTSTNFVSRKIQIQPEPSFTGTTTGPVPVSCGSSITLNGSAVSQTVTELPPSISGSPVTLPDGSGASYTSTLNFSGMFPAGATITAGCYPTLNFSLEHSFSGDLQIDLIAPSGQSVRVFDRHGGWTLFGTCANAADNLVPGCPANYSVVNSGGVAWTAAGVTTATSANCGGYAGACEAGNYYIPQTYTSTNSFAALNGAAMNGTWTLRIYDQAALDDGFISGWSLVFPPACFGTLQSATPDLTTATWSTSGSGPAVPAQTTTSTVVNNPGPSCPAPGPCVGNQLTNNVTIGPFTTAGSYVYSFTVTDEYGCQYRRSVTVNATCPCPSAVIGYTGSPFCNVAGSQAVTLTGIGSYVGGTYSALPAGLSINATTGAINTGASTPGTYTVTYNFAPGGGCPVINVTTSVTIVANPTLTVTSTSPICSGNNAVFNLTGPNNATVAYNINGGASISTTLSGAGTSIITVPSVTANTTLNATSITSAGIPVTGNGLSVSGGNGGPNAAGAISALGAAASATNCAFVDATNSVLTITLQHTVPAGTSITVSIARDTNTGVVTVSDGSASTAFSAAPDDVLQRITLVTGVATNTITVTRTGGVVWIDGVQYTFTPPGCSATIAVSNTVTVTPLPAIALSSAAATTTQTVCQNVGITAITYNVSNATGATVSGLPTGVTGSYAAGVFTISGTPTASGTFNYTVTTTGGCTPAATATGTITVTPLPAIVLSSAAATTTQTVCQNIGITAITYTVTNATGATVSGLPTGVTGSYAAGVFTISGTPTVSGTFNYTVTTTGGCTPAATATGTITVTVSPTLTLTSAVATTGQTICQNVAIATITYAVGGGATGATVSGLPTGVTGNYAAGVFTISGTPTASGTFNYTVTTTGGCAPAATATGTITVTPLPAIVLSSAAATTTQTVCQNIGITAITYTVSNATGATVSGLPTGVTGSYAAGVFTISGTPTASGTFNYTVTTTGGCAPAATATGTITVTPLPIIALSSAAATTTQTVCQNVGITAITYTVTNATGATVSGLPTGVTGSYAAGVFTISGAPTASGTFNYTVTTTGGCTPAATASGTINVNPSMTPVTGFSYTSPVCINDTNPIPTGVAGFTTGGTYSSTAGLTINGNTGEITLSASLAGTYTVTYSYPATACGPVGSSTFNITITPLPAIVLSSAAATTTQTVCQNIGITTITYTVTNATGATVSGLPTGVTGNYAAGVFTISGTPTVSGTFNYTVTTTGGCTPAATATGTITVTPLPTIVLSSAAATTTQTVCQNIGITTITYTVTNATGATVSGLPTGVTGSYAAGVFTISGTPTASGTFNYTVTTTGGCAPAATATGTITVTPLPSIVLSSAAATTTQTVCQNIGITAI
ncbi:MAG TPA: PKD domain-containing protein, partial [Flavobacterium sp.]|uniref:beta strand repeat-containing protein n=1 Tax=Flavobacterium sp. TaxID=239 RepID=UPI002C8B7078